MVYKKSFCQSLHKLSLAFTSTGKKSCVTWTIVFVLPLSKLETGFMETVVGHLDGEPQTPWLACIPNAALLSLKLLLSVGRNISSKKWLHDLLLNEDWFQQWFSIHNLSTRISIHNLGFDFTYFYNKLILEPNIKEKT